MTVGWCCSQQQLHLLQIWFYTHIIHTIEHKDIMFRKNPEHLNNIGCTPLFAMYKCIYILLEAYKTWYMPNELHHAPPVYSMSQTHPQLSQSMGNSVYNSLPGKSMSHVYPTLCKCLSTHLIRLRSCQKAPLKCSTKKAWWILPAALIGISLIPSEVYFHPIREVSYEPKFRGG